MKIRWQNISSRLLRAQRKVNPRLRSKMGFSKNSRKASLKKSLGSWGSFSRNEGGHLATKSNQYRLEQTN
jgi:hypothetical protein